MKRRSGMVRSVWMLRVMVGLLPLVGVPTSQGQTSSITSSGLNTQISHVAGQPNYDITGGTRPGNGSNLFHSFGDFSVGTNQVARFLNDSGLATTNILSRVTGGHPSNIFGAIQTTGFGNANLFLMNPAGIVFGPNASLNVGGSVTLATADYMRLTDGARFKAMPYGGADGLLSAAPVAAFGFLSSNPGTITIQGSQLTVPDGANLTLVGGDIHLTDGTLKASNGVFSLVSLARRGEAILHPGSNQPELSITPHTRMGSITVTRTATVIETDDGQSGAIVIRGGHLVLNSATLRAGTRSGNLYTSGQIDVRAAHVLLRDSQLIGNGLDSGSAIRVEAADVTLKGSQIKSDGPNAGPVILHAERVTLEGSQIDNDGFFDGGAIDVRAAQVMLNNSKIGSTGFGVSGGPITVRAAYVLLKSSQIGSVGGSAGGLIDVRAAHMLLRDSQLISNGFNAGGPIRVEAAHVTLRGSQISSGGTIEGGNITVRAAHLMLKGSHISSESPHGGHGGAIWMDAKDITLRDSEIRSTGYEGGGIINVDAKKVTLTNSQLTTSVSGNPVAVAPQAAGGQISVDAKKLTLRNAQILSTAMEGKGGTITIRSRALHRDVRSVIDASSQFGTDGTVTIDSRR